MTNYTYDAASQLTRLAHQLGATSINSFDYEEEWKGHPLAGRSSRHKVFPWEEFSFLPSQSTRRELILLVTRPCFRSVGVRPGPHQSPIRFKAVERSIDGVHLPPLASRLAPENCRYHAVSKVIGSQILWLIPCGRPTQVWLTAWAYHLIKSLPSCPYFRDGAAANQASWFSTNPKTSSLPRPSR
jgi:hypothetical protein